MITRTPPFRALTAIALLFSLSACATDENPYPRQELLPKYALQTETVSHEIRFSLSSSLIPENEKTRLNSFMKTVDIREGDMVQIENVSAEEDPLAEKRLMGLVALFESYGLRTRIMELPGTISHRIRIAYQKVTPVASACNGWQDRDQYDFGNLPMTNIGCSTQRNLLNALADKRDLYQTTEPTPTRADRMVLIQNARVKRAESGSPKLSSGSFQAGNLQ